MIESKNSKAILPLIEIIIALIIFVIAALITLQLFFLARFMGNKTKDRARAILEVQNIAEEIKAQDSAVGIEAIISSWEEGEIQDTRYLNFSADWEVGGEDFQMYIKINRENIADRCVYTFDIYVYKFESYPFIDDKYKGMDYRSRPFTEEVHVVKFVKK